MFKSESRWREDLPIYRQIMEAVMAAIMEGVYAEGQLIPSVRQLASEHHVSTLTAAKVLQELARDGLIEKRRGIGFEVIPGLRKRLLERERRKFLDQEWPLVQARIKRLGLGIEDLMGDG